MLVTMSDRQASASAADPLPLPRGEGRGEGAAPVDQAASFACATGSASVPPAVTGDDADQLAKAAAGDPAAFDGLVCTHQERITRLVHRLLGWSSDVDDVVQDVFVDVLRNLPRFDGRSNVLTWITRIAINRCRSHQRRQWLRLKFFRPVGGRVSPRLAIRVSERRGHRGQRITGNHPTSPPSHPTTERARSRNHRAAIFGRTAGRNNRGNAGRHARSHRRATQPARTATGNNPETAIGRMNRGDAETQRGKANWPRMDADERG